MSIKKALLGLLVFTHLLNTAPYPLLNESQKQVATISTYLQKEFLSGAELATPQDQDDKAWVARQQEHVKNILSLVQDPQSGGLSLPRLNNLKPADFEKVQMTAMTEMMGANKGRLTHVDIPSIEEAISVFITLDPASNQRLNSDIEAAFKNLFEHKNLITQIVEQATTDAQFEATNLRAALNPALRSNSMMIGLISRLLKQVVAFAANVVTKRPPTKEQIHPGGPIDKEFESFITQRGLFTIIFGNAPSFRALTLLIHPLIKDYLKKAYTEFSARKDPKGNATLLNEVADQAAQAIIATIFVAGFMPDELHGSPEHLLNQRELQRLINTFVDTAR